MPKKVDTALTFLFLAISAVLYYFILTAGGKLLIAAEYSAIVLCFLFALLHIKDKRWFILGGLACTLGADFCLVICDPIQQLWGMIFFIGAQSLYAAMLHKTCKSKTLLWIRLGLTAAAIAIAVLVLKDKTDPLALVSICYYINLIFNLIMAFAQFKAYKLLSIGLIFFLLCDTVIGLQVAAAGYLPITEGSALHNLIFAPFNLAWLFYLPSQILISLSSRKLQAK